MLGIADHGSSGVELVGITLSNTATVPGTELSLAMVEVQRGVLSEAYVAPRGSMKVSSNVRGL